MTDKNDTVTEKTTVADNTQAKSPSSEEINQSKPINKKPTAVNKSKGKPANTKKAVSKLALFSLVLIFLSWGIIAYFYTLFDEQKNVFSANMQSVINQQTDQQLITQSRQTQSLLAAQAALYEDRLRNLNIEVAAQSQKTIDKLQRTVDQLSATKPSDWLIHEAQYLIRVAVRTLWLEKDTRAAVSLLSDADNRLKELNDPSFLSVRQIIREDITRLQLLPKINTDEILLQLMALTTQIPQLSLAVEDILGDKEADDGLVLSDNVDDWKANLAQTWKQFLSDFITIREHSADIEPLLSLEQQQNVLTNIKLKLQQAQWAVSHGKEAVFRQTLRDTNLLIAQYFSKEAIVNQSFMAIVTSLINEQVKIDYPSELKAFSAINQAIEKKQVSHIEVLNITDPVNITDKSKRTEIVDSTSAEIEQVINSATDVINNEDTLTPSEEVNDGSENLSEQVEVKGAI